MKAVLNLESIFVIAGLVAMWLRPGIETPDRPGRLRPAHVVGLLALTAAAYARTLNWYFLSDDFVLLKHAESAWLNAGARFLVAGGDAFYRPAGYLVLGLTFPWAGTDPALWRAAGVAIHAVNGVLVLALASRIGLSRMGAWIAAAAFAIHGTRPESVIWLAGRFDLMATMLVLLGLLAFMRGWHIAALSAMTLAILSKESAYAFPLLLLLFERKRIRVLAPYFAVAAALAGWRLVLFHGIGGYSAGPPSIVAAAKALLIRLWAVLFFPVNWTLGTSWPLAAALAVYIAALAILFTARLSRSSLCLAIGFALIGALPALQQLAIGADLQKSRVFYLPSVGFCLLIGTAAANLKPWFGCATAAAVLVFQFTALWHNANGWRDASIKAHDVCAEAARSGILRPQPASVNGVYFFANGFPECVELQKAKRRLSPRSP